MVENIEQFFEPDSIAVIGATDDPDRSGYTLLQNLLDSFDGEVFAVNPNCERVLGLECHDSVLDVDRDVDLASVLIPAQVVPDVLRECVEKGVDAVYLGSGGFADAGESGARLQEEIVEIASEAGVRLWGPNCGGYISTNPSISNCYLLDTRGHADRYLGGNVSLVSQSGMMAGGIYTEIISEGLLDLGKTLTTGNRADVAESDVLTYLEDDDATAVVGIYQESIRKGREYARALESVSREKPVVVLKGGRTDGGTKAAMSHTGAIAGDDRIADAVMRQCGAVRVDDFRSLIDITNGFSMYPDGVAGDDIAILTMTGAGAVVGADLLEDRGLTMAELEADTLAGLAEIYPDWVEPTNPVDVWTTIEQLGVTETLTTCLELLLEDDGVDGVMVQSLAFSYFEEFDFDAFCAIAAESDKPVVTWLVGHAEHTPYWVDRLEENGIPVYGDLETCATFLAAAREYAAWRTAVVEEPVERGGETVIPTAADQPSRTAPFSGDGETLGEVAAKEFLSEWGLETTTERVAATAEEAVAAAAAIGYPVVLKIASADVHHKSDVGGVVVDVRTAAGVRDAFERIESNARAHGQEAAFDGVIVQEMITDGREVIVGVQNTDTFGPMVMVGLGGIFVEVLEDVAFRRAPLTERDARAMIDELDGRSLLDGQRGEPPADVDALVEVLLAVSALAIEHEESIAEIDINPLIVREEGRGAVVVDALVAGSPPT